MPKLIRERKIKRLDLPSYKDETSGVSDAWVEVFVSPKVSDKYELTKAKSNAEAVILAITKMVKAWNLTDENDKVLEINETTVKHLDSNDVDYIVKHCPDWVPSQDDEKKTD